MEEEESLGNEHTYKERMKNNYHIKKGFFFLVFFFNFVFLGSVLRNITNIIRYLDFIGCFPSKGRSIKRPNTKDQEQ